MSKSKLDFIAKAVEARHTKKKVKDSPFEETTEPKDDPAEEAAEAAEAQAKKPLKKAPNGFKSKA